MQLGLRDADIEAALRHPFRQLLKTDVIVSSIAVSIMLLIYYTAVAFSVIYLTTVFGLTLKDANGLGNWNWGLNVIAVILVGIISDRFRVRKPFMVIGGVLAAIPATRAAGSVLLAGASAVVLQSEIRRGDWRLAVPRLGLLCAALTPLLSRRR